MAAAWGEPWGWETNSQWWTQQPPTTKAWVDEDLVIAVVDQVYQAPGKWPPVGNGKGQDNGGNKGGDKGGDKGGYKGGGKGDGDGDGDGDGKGGGDGDGDGDGKGGGKGNGGKGKLKMGNYEPKPGDVLYFHPSRRHAFYDNFPDGDQVDADYYEIDLEKSITVEQTSSAKLDTQHPWWGQRTMKYVAVSFRSNSGSIVWTNFSRQGTIWMRFSLA